MNHKDIAEKLSKLSEKDLILFRANINVDFCSYPVWESRMEIMGDIVHIVEEVAKDKGYNLPSIEQIVRMSREREELEDNLQKYLGTSWDELDKSYNISDSSEAPNHSKLWGFLFD